ncbi:MAG: hypothetical protein KIS92_17280 [Planctomycetota bacterium]|nr:hypothetical protein [Planctomycetota bacterium]
MHRHKIASGLCAASLFALALGCGGGGPPPETPSAAPGPAKTVASASNDKAEKAPPIKGGAWFTKDGQAPDLKGKAYIVEFWSVY